MSDVSSPAHDLLQEIRQQAMRWLAQREYTRSELRNKLLRRFSSGNADSHEDMGAAQREALLDEVLTWLETSNYLNDARCAEMLVRSHIERGHGPLRIRQDLLQARGLTPEVADAAIKKSDCDWLDLALRVARGRARQLPKNTQEKVKLMRFLQGRGFSPSDCRKAAEALH